MLKFHNRSSVFMDSFMLRDKSYAILTLDLLDGMSDFVPSSRSADIPAPGGLGT